VKRSLQTLNPNKASGLDDIGQNILKSCGDSIVAPLTFIINKEFRKVYSLELLKQHPLFHYTKVDLNQTQITIVCSLITNQGLENRTIVVRHL